ncbi:MAG: Calcium-translocating P-type ATPase, PMCA-type [Candidatus Yanofskybacteria bacterium GW2011_GWA1_48_10]|uniref:Calcium-translocating P-type ATPase, PMCA-type n=2 Tax=Parcubacteria group TaxID=1794811 RepID=A0A0G1WGR2_9BACT|nr:MAG: Calcium-translocating P-type ATPase, PMCA-type [Candidatus Nomurabacteria bacterium GW2011_GWB1_47_6]KKU89508.1 MAG: Calcium-translocating P-type ATPase, PMCA-type [Candidatus Yanofskybacteria bacterium GW2011_GWA1_48_10]
MSASETFQDLQTSEKGLTDKEAKVRLAEYGKNVFLGRGKTNPAILFGKQFLSPLIFLLLGSVVLTALLGAWLDMWVVLAVVLLNAGLGFFHEYNAENTLEKLKTYIKDRARIIREGREEEIDSELVVPGDILKLAYGARIPADARILDVNNFRVDEAILTGEALPVEKNEKTLPMSVLVAERKNIAHAGTLVVQGYAIAAVYATGNATEIGQIAGIVSKTTKTKTPLQKGVDRLAWVIFGAVLIVVAGILILGIMRGESFIQMLLLSSAVAVGAVPESLPIALTVILAMGSLRIAQKKGVVRQLAASETLGSTTLIMTDKTGTLTMADMKLTGIYSTHHILHSGNTARAEEGFTDEQKSLLELALFNVDVSIENPREDRAKWTFKGRPFEINIVKAARLHNVPLHFLSASISHQVLPFNSTNKFSVSHNDKEYILMGAPDVLLKRAALSKEEYLRIETWIEKESREGKRLIGIAKTERKHGKKEFSMAELKNVEFLGMFTFVDPIRPEVPAAILNIESHGIKMVLVTGDLSGTALSVAKELNWHVKEDEVLTGVDVRELEDSELLEIIPKIKIFARVTPEDKLRIGKLYQSLGEVVAMTGDGVNDAPALKAMDIGISLGSGSDVAKSAADLVLLNDNFETISLAIDEGRKILGNIRKTVVYLMSNSLDEVFVIGGSLLLSLPFPLTALQIIWVNLFTGSLPALAFAFDDDIDGEKFAGRQMTLIFSREVKIITFGIGVLSSLLLLILHYGMNKLNIDPAVARAIFFVCFSSYILFIAFSFRSLHRPLFSYDIFSNKKLNWAVLTGVALLVFTMSTSFMRGIFHLPPLPLYALPFIIFWIILNVLLVEGAKYVMRKKLV